MTDVIDNAAAQRFELSEENATATADYHINDDTLYVDYVESPPSLRGKGTAGRLMQGIVETAQARGLKIVPICGYAAAWLKRNAKTE